MVFEMCSHRGEGGGPQREDGPWESTPWGYGGEGGMSATGQRG